MQNTTRSARKVWLRQIGVQAGWRGAAATALTIADAAPAVAFAAGLACGLTALPRSVAAASPWFAMAAGAAIARGACAWGAGRLGAGASVAVRDVTRRRIMVACLAAPAWGRRPAGELLISAVEAVEALDGYVARFHPARRAAGLVPVLVLAAVAVASPACAGILAATIIPFVALMILAGGAAADRANKQLSALALLSGLFADRVRHLPLVLAYQSEALEAARLGKAADALRRRTMDVLRIAFISSTGLDFFAALSVALVAVYAGLNLLRVLPFPAPQMGLASALFVLTMAPEFYGPMRRLAVCYHDRQAAEAAADSLMAIERGQQVPPAPLEPLAAAPSIHFADVAVSYPGEDVPAVHDFELFVRPGEIVALVGPSGAGKTTLLNLLLGLAPLSAGEVWIGDTALSQVGSIAPWVSWLGQAPLIASATIGENIALSRPGADPAEIAAAAAMAGLNRVLESRAGLDTVLNERGSGLSGGERRRVALARALLKDSRILLLDEPTANLDAVAACEFVDIIRQAAAGRTTIIATHSATVMTLADRVIRLGGS